MIKIHFIVVKLNDYTVYHSKIELNLLGNASRIKRIETLKMLFKNAEFYEIILSPETSQTQTTIFFCN